MEIRTTIGTKDYPRCAEAAKRFNQLSESYRVNFLQQYNLIHPLAKDIEISEAELARQLFRLFHTARGMEAIIRIERAK